MRKLSVLLICLWSGGFVGLTAQAQDQTAGVIFFQHRQFKIPFKNDQKNMTVKQVRLYVSSDQGRTWNFTAAAEPQELHFRFSTPQDGYFWFTVQTVDDQGKLHPPTQDEFRANLKVIVDTIAPVVHVHALPNRQNEVGVSWAIKRRQPRHRPPRCGARRTIGSSAEPTGFRSPCALRRQSGLLGSRSEWPVRGARHRPGSRQATSARKKPPSPSAPAAGGCAMFVNPVPGAGLDPLRELDRKFVNSKQVNLSYDLKGVGPSGVSAVELWYTLYKARAWNKLKEFPSISRTRSKRTNGKNSPSKSRRKASTASRLWRRAASAWANAVAQPGERPQFWIEVDVTKPVVQIIDVQVRNGFDKGKLTIAWNARDKNLGAQPIRLSYAEQKDGAWTGFADKVANTGKHTWKMPDGLPYQFYLRVEAVDLAGNVGEATTNDKVKVDLSLPKANILQIEPGR